VSAKQLSVPSNVADLLDSLLLHMFSSLFHLSTSSRICDLEHGFWFYYFSSASLSLPMHFEINFESDFDQSPQRLEERNVNQVASITSLKATLRRPTLRPWLSISVNILNALLVERNSQLKPRLIHQLEPDRRAEATKSTRLAHSALFVSPRAVDFEEIIASLAILYGYFPTFWRRTTTSSARMARRRHRNVEDE
jgi:hypothetical protein